METEAGKLARLPDGQPVKIEEVHSDGYATVRRIDGDRRGTVAVCATEKLVPMSQFRIGDMELRY